MLKTFLKFRPILKIKKESYCKQFKCLVVKNMLKKTEKKVSIILQNFDLIILRMAEKINE